MLVINHEKKKKNKCNTKQTRGHTFEYRSMKNEREKGRIFFSVFVALGQRRSIALTDLR